MGAEAHTVTATLADAFGNPVSGQAEAVTGLASATLGDGEMGAFIAHPNDPGSYLASVTSTSAGAKPIVVSYAGDELRPAGNGDAAFRAGTVAVDRTTLVAPEQLRADGIDAGPVTASVFDTFGNPSDSTDAVELLSTLGGFGETSRSDPGQFQASMSSGEAGIGVVRVRVDGRVAPVTAEVEFVAGQNTQPKDDDPGDDEARTGPPAVGGPQGAPSVRGAELPQTGASETLRAVALGTLLLGLGAWALLRARRRRLAD